MLKVVGASWLQTKVSSYILAGLGILGIVTLFVGEIERIEDDGNYSATVYWSSKAGFRIEFWGQGNELSEVPMGAARAYCRHDLPTIGWSRLEIESDGSYPDWVQAYAAGLLEGALTWHLIYSHWQNIIESRCNKHPKDCKKIREQLEMNMHGVRNRGIRNQEDALWHQINLYYHQLDGLSTGWNFAVKRSRNDMEISLVDFVWMNSINDVMVIERMLNLTSRSKIGEDLPGLSAAFVRLVTEKNNDDNTYRERVFVGHNSAGSYNTMLRFLKHYKLSYHSNLLPTSPKVPGVSIKFSSYPGAISSMDDLYTITAPGSNKPLKSVTGTSLSNFNEKLWTKVNLVDHVLIGPRVMAANRLATSGWKWSHLISRVNSGTALKQWTVLNFANLTTVNTTATPAVTNANSKSSASPDNSLYRYIHSTIDGELSANPALWHLVRRRAWRTGGPGLLWVIEQMPGHTHAADQTNVLRAKGYWADYGIPHYQDIKEISGIKDMEAKHGDIYSSLKSPRAVVFKNGFETATDIDSVILLMRSNHYEQEVVSNDKLATRKPDDNIEEIEPEDIVSDSEEVKQIIISLETVKSHVESKDSDSVGSILTPQEQTDITAQVNEILEQLALTDSGESRQEGSESESAEHLNLESDSVEEIEDRLVAEGSWHGLGARGDLHGWLGEDQYGLVPMGVIDNKALSGTSEGIDKFEVIAGPSYSRALETSLEALLKPATRKKAKFGFAALLDKIRKSNLRFVSSSSEEEEDSSEKSEEIDPRDFEDALEHVINTNIEIDPPKPYSVPPFQWSKSSFKNIPHHSQPDLWSFKQIKTKFVW